MDGGSTFRSPAASAVAASRVDLLALDPMNIRMPGAISGEQPLQNGVGSPPCLLTFHLTPSSKIVPNKTENVLLTSPLTVAIAPHASTSTFWPANGVKTFTKLGVASSSKRQRGPCVFTRPNKALILSDSIPAFSCSACSVSVSLSARFATIVALSLASLATCPRSPTSLALSEDNSASTPDCLNSIHNSPTTPIVTKAPPASATRITRTLHHSNGRRWRPYAHSNSANLVNCFRYSRISPRATSAVQMYSHVRRPVDCCSSFPMRVVKRCISSADMSTALRDYQKRYLRAMAARSEFSTGNLARGLGNHSHFMSGTYLICRASVSSHNTCYRK